MLLELQERISAYMTVIVTSLQVSYASSQRLCCCYQLGFSVLQIVMAIHIARAQAFLIFFRMIIPR